MKQNNRTPAVLLILATALFTLALAFVFDPWGRRQKPDPIPLVDMEFVTPDTFRVSYAELIRRKADISDFECNGCHDLGKPPTLQFDADHNIIVPAMHEDSVVMGHGSHDRNNLCFNCHDENNLELLQTRDGRQLKLHESTPLCGSCHGPTFRDWEDGVHGRTGGHWNEQLGTRTRQICVDCHNPHHPKIPGRKPAPPPNPLHPQARVFHNRSAELNSAVSPICNRQGVESSLRAEVRETPRRIQFCDTADCKSALRAFGFGWLNVHEISGGRTVANDALT